MTRTRPATHPTTIDTFLREAAAVDAIEPSSVPAVGLVLEDCYELRERLGAGGMAMVYRAYDRRLSREVAIKMPRASSDRGRIAEMFEREARATARLCHPNIVTLHHVGTHAGAPFAVLELLVGETLADRLGRRHTLPIAEALPILDGVLAALAYAHERGIVHRDLKPGNVFLTTDQRVKLLDFGVAVEHGIATGTQTRAAGTPGYMAPEHAAAPDPRNDIWAAAVLFLECVTGHRPAIDGVPEIPDELPRDVRDMLARAVARDPDRRPRTASAMRTVLVRRLISRGPRRPRRRPARWVAAAALVLVALAGVAIARRQPAAAPDRAAMLIPANGRWRGDPAAGTPWETHLQRVDATHFSYKQINRQNGRSTSGLLTLEKLADGTTLLSGKIADDPTCSTCTNVGFIEFIILDDKHIYQNRSAWGKSHDHYVEWFPVYRYKWEGPLSGAARN